MMLIWPVLTTALWVTSGLAISLRGSLGKLNHPECGITPNFASAESVTTLLLTNGQEAQEGQFPWIVSLRYRRGGDPYSQEVHKCGGTLIGERMVVTAAHCIAVINDLQLTTVLTGQINIGEVEEDNNEYAVESTMIHEDYKTDGTAAINDIALLILAKRVRFNANVRPACVYHRDTDQLDNPGEDGFQVAGWGTTETGYGTDYLMWLPFTRIPANTCQKETRKNKPEFVLLESQLCATGDNEKRADACRGDSGGPMVTRVDSKWYLAGIVSYGSRICDSSIPGFYTRVASYYEWLEQNMITTDQPKGKPAPSLPGGVCSLQDEACVFQDVVSLLPGVSTLAECRQLCTDKPTCAFLTHFGAQGSPLPNTCVLLSTCGSLRESKDCTTEDSGCQVGPCSSVGASTITDNLVQYLSGTTEEADCWAACQSTEACAFYTHYSASSVLAFPSSCFLLSTFQKPVKPCDHCRTGASDCSNAGGITTTSTTTSTTSAPTAPPVWAQWGGWSSCTKTCGRGSQARHRTCSRGSSCPGADKTKQSCNTHDCPAAGIIISGGTNDHSNGGLSSVETWPAAPCSLPALPEVRYRHSASMINGTKIVICGGSTSKCSHGSSNGCRTRSCITRSPGQDWQAVSPALREDRRYHSAVSAGNTVIIIGGETAGSKMTGEVVPGGATFPLLRDRESACSILVTGGFVVTGGGYHTAHSHVDRYSLSGEHLATLPSLQTPRRAHACAAFRDSEGRTALLVLGGTDGSSYHSSVELLSGLEAASWQAAAPLPRPLSSLRAATLPDGRVLATGGKDKYGTARAEVLQYSEAGPGEGDSWTEVGKMEEARANHAITVIEDLEIVCQ